MVVTNDGISLSRLPVFLTYITRYILLEPIRLLEILIYDRRIKSHTLKNDPIFIIGHWRSGTSFLQTLLTKDANNLSTTIYKFIFSDNYYLTESWLKKPLNKLSKYFNIKYSFQRLPMNFDIPGELDPGLCANCSDHAYTWGHLFPKSYEKWFNRYIIINDDKIAQAWVDEYDYLIRKLSFQNKNKQIVIKSPGDTGRISVLLNKYPKAKFIYMHRDPIEVFHSTFNLWQIILKENSFQTINKDKIAEYIISSYKKLLINFLDQKKNMPNSQLIEIEFNDIQENTIQVLSRIYAVLNLGSLPIEDINSFLSNNKDYKVNSYATSEELKSMLQVEWSFSFKTWATR